MPEISDLVFVGVVQNFAIGEDTTVLCVQYLLSPDEWEQIKPLLPAPYVSGVVPVASLLTLNQSSVVHVHPEGPDA